jgi:hypothetical protein
MAVTQSTNLRNTELASGTAGPAGSATFDRVALYTGAPVGGGAAQTGTLIATLTLSATPFAAPSAGSAALNSVADVTAAAGGTIGSFLFYKSTQTNANTSVPAAGDNRLNGSVGTSGADWTIDNATVVVGQTIHVSSFSVTAPS